MVCANGAVAHAPSDDRHGDEAVVLWSDAPARRGAEVAQNGSRAACEDRGNSASGRRRRCVTPEVDAVVHRTQEPTLDTPVARATPKPKGHELLSGHDAALALGNRADQLVNMQSCHIDAASGELCLDCITYVQS